MDITKDFIEAASEAQPEDNIIEALRSRCMTSKTFNAMCHVFALRERTRQQIAVLSLQQAMIKEGFKHTKAQYAEELRFMASIGIGKLKTDKKGRILALTHVLVTLQSIGLAAVSKQESLKTWKPAVHFHDLQIKRTAASYDPKLKPPRPLRKESAPVKVPESFQAYLTLIVEGKILQFDLLPEFSTQELFSLLAKAMAKGANK